jgi:hypothetical protein
VISEWSSFSGSQLLWHAKWFALFLLNFLLWFRWPTRALCSAVKFQKVPQIQQCQCHWKAKIILC